MVQLFFHCVSLAQAELEHARRFLAEAAERNLVKKNERAIFMSFFFVFQPELLKQLSDILVNATNNPTARAQAGKRTIDGRPLHVTFSFFSFTIEKCFVFP